MDQRSSGRCAREQDPQSGEDGCLLLGQNRGQGENFRDKDIIFECFHNYLAFSQWGNTLYNIMKKLDAVNGDPSVRSWFEKTMTSDPDEMDNSPFTPLDRFVMELFRTISPNGGSVSSLAAIAQFFGAGYTGFSTIITPHPETSTAPITGTTRKTSIRIIIRQCRRVNTTTRARARKSG
jgi:hypothetical protein